jgi:hypothetical protein
MNENHLDNKHIRLPLGVFLLTPKYFPIAIKGNYQSKLFEWWIKHRRTRGGEWGGGGGCYNVVSAIL